MKVLLSFALLLTSLAFCIGCGEKPVSTEKEEKELYESPDYEKQMMGEMTGSEDTANP